MGILRFFSILEVLVVAEVVAGVGLTTGPGLVKFLLVPTGARGIGSGPKLVPTAEAGAAAVIPELLLMT